MPGLFERQLAVWGLVVEKSKLDLLHSFVRLLINYDRANVIGTDDYEAVLQNHVLDALSCMLIPEVRAATRLADVGSGGGLPGIPLSIMFPDARMTLFEATGKKAAFLRYASRELGLGNVEVANVRVEEAARKDIYRAAFDVCTVRAVARLPVIAEYCLPLLQVGGHVVAMKGREDPTEWTEGERAARELGGRIRQTLRVPLSREMEQKQRRLVLLEKEVSTPAAYPRKVGVPAKKPLGKT